MALLSKKPAEEAPVEAPVAAPVAADASAPEETKAKKDKKAKVQYLQPNQMNFLTQYELVVEGKKKNLDLGKVMKPLIAVAALVLVVFVLMEVVLLGMKAKGKSMEKYINDSQNVATYNEAIATKEKIDQANTQKANMEAAIDAIKTYGDVDAAFFNNIAKVATKNGVTITNYSYSAESGYLSLACDAKAVAPSTTGISQFVRDLEGLGVFNSVEYNSFSGSKEDGYGFSVSATFNPVAAK